MSTEAMSKLTLAQLVAIAAGAVEKLKPNGKEENPIPLMLQEGGDWASI